MVQSLVLPTTGLTLFTFYHSCIPVLLDFMSVNWSRMNSARQLLPLNLMKNLPVQPHLLLNLSPEPDSDSDSDSDPYSDPYSDDPYSDSYSYSYSVLILILVNHCCCH